MPQATGTIQLRRGVYNANNDATRVLAKAEPVVLKNFLMVFGAGNNSNIGFHVTNNKVFNYQNEKSSTVGGVVNEVQLSVDDAPTQTSGNQIFLVRRGYLGQSSNVQNFMSVNQNGHSTTVDTNARATNTVMRVNAKDSHLSAFRVFRETDLTFEVKPSGRVIIDNLESTVTGSSLLARQPTTSGVARPFQLTQQLSSGPDNLLLVHKTAGSNSQCLVNEFLMSGRSDEIGDTGPQLRQDGGLFSLFCEAKESVLAPDASPEGAVFRLNSYFVLRGVTAPGFMDADRDGAKELSGNLMLVSGAGNNGGATIVCKKAGTAGNVFEVRTTGTDPKIISASTVTAVASRHEAGLGGVMNTADDAGKILTTGASSNNDLGNNINYHTGNGSRCLSRNELVKMFEDLHGAEHGNNATERAQSVFGSTGHGSDSEGRTVLRGDSTDRYLTFRISFGVITPVNTVNVTGKHLQFQTPDGSNIFQISGNAPGGSTFAGAAGLEQSMQFHIRVAGDGQ
tara:strand:+ start:6343 stop:7869 length:1527 start_codon:yes stop_codon:yes gene_type:complete